MADPSVWGPLLWCSIHFVALGYPSSPSTEQASAYNAFFTSLQYTIPCKTCRDNYARHLRELPIDRALRSGGDALFAWSVALHNIVNQETGKRVYTVDEARQALLRSRLTHVAIEAEGGVEEEAERFVHGSDPTREPNWILIVALGATLLLGTVLAARLLRSQWKLRVAT